MAEIESNNHFLKHMPPADGELIEKELEAIDLPVRFELEPMNKPISHVYFLERGLASVVARNSRGLETEITLIGSEGWTGQSLVLGARQTPNRTFMQVSGAGFRVASDVFLNACDRSEILRRFALRFVHLCFVNASQTALVNAHGRLEERLARWLLMASDRLGSDSLDLTHEFISHMLGVRRAGVSLAIQEFARKGVLANARGRVEIRDRQTLADCANGYYGVPESEFQRLLAVR